MEPIEIEEALPRTASKTLRMDIVRMASIEKENILREGHALSPKEHDVIVGVCDVETKRLMYSNSLRKRSLDLPLR